MIYTATLPRLGRSEHRNRLAAYEAASNARDYTLITDLKLHVKEEWRDVNRGHRVVLDLGLVVLGYISQASSPNPVPSSHSL